MLPGGWTVCQADGPAVGSVETTRLLSRPAATHSEVEGQETACRPGKPKLGNGLWSMRASCQAELPPVGSVEVRTSPWLSTATHRVVAGHEIASSAPQGMSMCVTDQAADGLVGSVE